MHSQGAEELFRWLCYVNPIYWLTWRTHEHEGYRRTITSHHRRARAYVNTHQLSRACDVVFLRYTSCKSIYNEIPRKLLNSAVGLHHFQKGKRPIELLCTLRCFVVCSSLLLLTLVSFWVKTDFAFSLTWVYTALLSPPLASPARSPEIGPGWLGEHSGTDKQNKRWIAQEVGEQTVGDTTSKARKVRLKDEMLWWRTNVRRGDSHEKVGDARREFLFWPQRGTKKGVVQAFLGP